MSSAPTLAPTVALTVALTSTVAPPRPDRQINNLADIQTTMTDSASTLAPTPARLLLTPYLLESLQDHPIGTYTAYVSTRNKTHLFMLYRENGDRFNAWDKKTGNSVRITNTYAKGIEYSPIEAGCLGDRIPLKRVGTPLTTVYSAVHFWSLYEIEQNGSSPRLNK